MTPAAAWFGCNIRTALRNDETTVKGIISLRFAKMLSQLNLPHPWTDRQSASEAVESMIAFDPTWTLEDFGLFFDLAAKGKLKTTYQRPNVAWLAQCQVAYNERKFEERERLTAQMKLIAENAMREKEHPYFTGVIQEAVPSRRPRSMADFLKGENRLTAVERAEMAERDKQRRS